MDDSVRKGIGTTWSLPRLSLGAKLLASFSLVLLPVLGLLVYGYRDANGRRIETTLDQQMQTAQAVGALVETSFGEAISVDWAVANDPVVRTLDEPRLDPHLQRLASAYPQFEAIAVFDRDGNNVSSTLPPRPRSERVQIAGEPWFQRLMATEQPVVSEVLISPRTSVPTIVVAVPLRDDGGRVIGTVMTAMALETLSQKLQDLAVNPNQSVMLIDPTGIVAFHTALPQISWDQRNVADFQPIKTALGGESTREREFISPLLGDKRIGAFVPTTRYGWVVGITTPVDVALAPIRDDLRSQLLGFGIVTLLSMGLVIALSRAFLGPIRHLIDHALALGQGDLQQRVDIETGDEIEELGQSFNRMAERLESTLTDLRSVLNATESGILMYDRNLLVRLVNRQMSDWFELDPLQIVGQPIGAAMRNHIAPRLADPEQLLAHLDDLLEPREDVTLDDIQAVGPEHRIFRVYGGPVGTNGERIGSIQVYTDVTEIRRREEERQALGRVAEILVREHTLERVADVVVEQAERVLHHTRVTLFLTDIPHGEVRLIAHHGFSPQSIAQLSVLPLTASSLAAQAVRTVQAQEIPDVLTIGPELAIMRQVAEREGNRSLLAQPLVARGRPVGVLTFAHPLPNHFTRWERDFIHAFADLCAFAVENARLYDELRESLYLRDEFLSTAAHELKTPIASIRGHAQLLLRSKAERPPREQLSLEVIERQTGRITRLAEDLMETTNPATHLLRRQTIDLVAATDQMIREASHSTTHHQLTLSAPVPVLLDADPELIQRVLSTLLNNAMRFSPQGGGIEVSVSMEDDLAHVAVRDHGLGIPPERQRHVFEPFYEPFPAGTPGYYGASGLGLFVVKTIVERHGGRMWFESEENHGSTFHFALPRGLGAGG